MLPLRSGFSPLTLILLGVMAASVCAGTVLAQAAAPAVGVQALDARVTLVENAYGAQAVQPDGRLVVEVGQADGTSILQRFGADGALDSGFSANGLRIREVDTLLPLASGQTMILGRFGADPNANGGDAVLPDPATLLRVNADGSWDSVFRPASLSFDWVACLKALSNGGTLVGGYTSTASTDADTLPDTFGLVHVGSTGVTDSAFQPIFAPGDSLIDLQMLPDGRVLLATSPADDSAPSALFVLGADGARDASFQPALPAGSEIDAFAVLSDGRVLVASSVAAGDDDAETETLTLLAPDGSADPTFAPATLSGDIDALYALDTGGALAQGYFSEADGTGRYGLRRVVPDGRVTVVPIGGAGDDYVGVSVFPGGGFAVGLNVANDGAAADSAVAFFDASGAMTSREALRMGESVTQLAGRLDGGVYASLSSVTFEPLSPVDVTGDNGGFSPPPAGGVSTIKAGPTVSISVLRAEAYAGGRRKAKFLLTRTGDTSKPLRVSYLIKGTAGGGRDYLPLRSNHVIKAGRSTARIRVRPVGAQFGRVKAGRASVKLELVERRAYTVGTPAVAKVRLLNHPEPSLRP